jgi:hypothetical protein
LLAANPYIETDYGEFIRGKEGSNLIWLDLLFIVIIIGLFKLPRQF